MMLGSGYDGCGDDDGGVDDVEEQGVMVVKLMRRKMLCL